MPDWFRPLKYESSPLLGDILMGTGYFTSRSELVRKAKQNSLSVVKFTKGGTFNFHPDISATIHKVAKLTTQDLTKDWDDIPEGHIQLSKNEFFIPSIIYAKANGKMNVIAQGAW